jgi:opacity protein-like surface antigen
MVSSAWDLGLGYRFVNINEIEISDSVGTDNFDLGIQQHVIELGLGFRF